MVEFWTKCWKLLYIWLLSVSIFLELVSFWSLLSTFWSLLSIFWSLFGFYRDQILTETILSDTADVFPLVTVGVKSTPLNKGIWPLRQHLLPPSPVQRQETSDHQCSGPNVSVDSLDSSPFHAQEEVLTSSSWTDQASDFRQEIRQSNYRNDTVKYDLMGEADLGSGPSTDLSCSPCVIWS